MGFQGGLVSIASRRDVRLVTDRHEDTNNVAAGGVRDDVIHRPPIGMIDTIVALEVKINTVPSGGTTGSHAVELQIEEPDRVWRSAIIEGRSNFDASINFEYSHWLSANNRTRPAGDVATLLAIQGLSIAAGGALVLRYLNDTDVTADNTRVYKLVMRRQTVES